MINTTVLFIMELLGTIAFSCSGAMVAIRKKLDLLGVIVLGVIAAVGGGMFRDILIGNNPPMLFKDPFFVIIAVISAIAMFLIVQSQRLSKLFIGAEHYDWIMNFLDAIGLGAFTVVGVNAAVDSRFHQYYFLTIFLGVITGVGGGLLRDIMVCEIPSILKEHIYACASLIGALLYALSLYINLPNIGIVLSAAIVIIIRVLSKHYDWNLPQSQLKE